ncbi:hypothetical protein [Pseudomonas sp. BN102]|uniref:hypothetical protein n=1 Tax=Pseudomonas sp. BN102 TaxID=2567886 RepID=UPI00245678E5|nr:hypothetical protein [Pseudomonas sp. BN102]
MADTLLAGAIEVVVEGVTCGGGLNEVAREGTGRAQIGDVQRAVAAVEGVVVAPGDPLVEKAIAGLKGRTPPQCGVFM